MNTVEFECVCPNCNERLTHATAINSDELIMPNAGDVTVCATCVTLLEFDEDIKPFKTDISSLEPEVQVIVEAAIDYLRAAQQKRTLH